VVRWPARTEAYPLSDAAQTGTTLRCRRPERVSPARGVVGETDGRRWVVTVVVHGQPGSVLLPDDEIPVGRAWIDLAADHVLALIDQRCPLVEHRPRVVAVDGRSGSGKSTLTRALAAGTGTHVVATDDLAWHHSFFDWTDELIEQVLAPVHRGEAVRHRPPAWIERERPGAIDVPAGVERVLVEGVGAGRRELAEWVDAIVWVRSDPTAARRRGIARDGDDPAAEEFWDEWMAAEIPFQDAERTWERAALVVDGTAPPVVRARGLIRVAAPAGAMPTAS
jgi:hypothetical protein